MMSRKLFQSLAVLVVAWFALAPASAQEAMTLTSGQSLEREISGGQTHSYRLTLQAGQFVHFELEQKSCDVVLTLTAPDNKPLVEATLTPFGLPESLSEEAVAPGEYQLTVRSIDFPKMTGAYHLQVEVKTAATANDKKRIQAERLLTEIQKTTNPQQRLEKAQQLITLWRELGERFWEGNAHVHLASAYSLQQNWAQAIENIEFALAMTRALKLRVGEAYNLNSLAFQYQMLRQTDKAIELAKQALTIAQDIKANSLAASILSSLGDFHFSKALYEQALGFYEQANELRLAIGNTGGESSFINVKGMIAQRQKKYDEAQKLYEAALAKAREQKSRGMEIQILLNLGDLASPQQQTGKMIAFYEQALSIARETSNRPRELDALMRLGRIYYSLGPLSKMIETYQAALPIARELRNYLALTSILGNLGDGAENNEKRLKYYEEALEVAHQTGDKRQIADLLQGVCMAQKSLGNIEKAISFCEQSIPLTRETGYHSAENFALRNLGEAWAQLFQYEKALSLFEEALAVAQKNNYRTGITNAYAALGALHVFLGQHDKAREYIEKDLQGQPLRRSSAQIQSYSILGQIFLINQQPEKAIEIHEKLLAFFKEDAPDSLGVANGLFELGKDYIALGRYETAQEHIERALQMYVRIGQPHALSQLHLSLGDALHGLKQYDKAAANHQQALLLSRQYPTGTPYEAPYHEQLMKDWKALGNPSLAIFFGKQAVNANQDLRFSLRNLEKDLQQSFLKSKEQTYRELADLLISQGRLPEAEQVIRMLKDEEYFEYVRRDNKNAPKSEKAALTPEEAALDKRYREIADQLTAVGTERSALLEKKTRTAEEEKQLAKLEADLVVAAQVFQKFLDQLSAELGKNKTSDSQIYNVQQSQALMEDLRELGKGTAALYTLVGEEKFRVILTTSDVQKAYEFPIKAADLNRKVLDLRAVLQNPKLDPLPLAQELYKILVAPLARDLRVAKIETLMWSLDGVLRYVPMAALHDGKQYLVESWRNVVFTNESKARLKDNVSQHWRALGLGVTKSFGERIPALPGVADEMRGIIRDEGSQTGVLPGTIKLDDQFTLEAMQTGLRARPSVVHVASHFQFQPGNETDSKLLLGDGNFLSLAQIKTMPNVFGGVELLTLSACNTATGGSGANGKEIEGFGMLAQQKGAKAVVASLWPVADRSTKELMKEFYQRREATRSTKGEALRQAQLKLLRGELVMTVDLTKREIVHEADKTANLPTYKTDPKKPYAHPYYWAPFILIGNWK